MNTQSTPYTGTRRKLVLAFDVGTTYSGISYSILDPGQVPEIKGVNRFPGHEQIRGESKIPTVIYYDSSGNVRAVGAEAMREGVSETALDEGWTKAEWFKLHIRPKSEGSDHITSMIPPLPCEKTVVRVLADFLQYFHECAMTYIKSAHPNGEDLWRSISSDIEYVISHPNGWEGYQQSQIRSAIVLAGLVPDTENGNSRVTFVTEGEASLHFAINYGFPAKSMKVGDGVIIVDAGGGTIDISAYRKKEDKVNEFEEITIPQCHFFGSVFVSVQARVFLDEYLKESVFHDDLDHIVKCFDKSTKVRFNDDSRFEYVKFGATRDNDPSYNIRYGQLKLHGTEIAKFFEPSVKCVVDSILSLIKQGSESAPIKHVVLVGGFAANEWLASRVNQMLKPHGLSVIRPDSLVNKAVSDGAVSFYMNRFVKVRIAKMAYGTIRGTTYDPNNEEHQKRSSDLYENGAGKKLVLGYFQVVIPKDAAASEDEQFKTSLSWTVRERERLRESYADVWCYTGLEHQPRWKDTDKKNYRKLCTVNADLFHLPATHLTNPHGKKYWTVEYTLVLRFTTSELSAQIAWKEEGVEKRTPAKIIYEPNDI